MVFQWYDSEYVWLAQLKVHVLVKALEVLVKKRNLTDFSEIEDKKKRISVNSEAAKRIVSHELHEYESKKPRANTQ